MELRKFKRRLHYGVNPVVAMALSAMVFFSLSRFCLALWQLDNLDDLSFSWLFSQGLRVDFASVCALFALPLLALLIASLNPYVRVPRFILFVLRVYGTLGLTFIVFNELMTPWFISDFKTRPNHIFVHYMQDIPALLATLWDGHKLDLLVVIAGTLLALYGSYRLCTFFFKSYHQGTFKYNALVLVITICIVPLGVRSSFDHSPFNPDMVAISDNSVANALPLNSSYSVIYNLFHLDELPIFDPDKGLK